MKIISVIGSKRTRLTWSIMLNASLNSWIWSWLNMAKTLEVARWALFLVVPRRPAVLREDILEAEGLVSLVYLWGN